jgi:hypothetical protein
MSQESISAYRKQSGGCEKFHDGQKDVCYAKGKLEKPTMV